MRLSFACGVVLLLSACDAGITGGNQSALPTGPAAVPGFYEGHCEAPFPEIEPGGWRHSIKTPLFVTSQGSPNHRVRDLILPPDEGGLLRAHFTYGATDKDLEDEDVELWVQACPDWVFLGVYTTDDDGIVYADIPADLSPGDYQVRFVVQGDGSTADGEVAVWRPGMKVVVTDVDGTLTTSDWQLLSDVVFGQDAQMYPDANTAMQTWVDKGYRVVYLTGRPQYVNRYTNEWLTEHGFPKGPVQLTEETGQILPSDSGVRVFKADKLIDLEASVGIEWVTAYGNATTDIGAYDDAGIPKEDTYIIGPNAGVDGTQVNDSYTNNLPIIASYPDVVQP